MSDLAMLSEDEDWCYKVADNTLMSEDRTSAMQIIRSSVCQAEMRAHAVAIESLEEARLDREWSKYDFRDEGQKFE